uniref:Cytochrome c domain-containing protein n=1 Tax=Solibacter usitatus (strain Ellin6076) TaxID=234267 RepID=Q020C3_SOLUE
MVIAAAARAHDPITTKLTWSKEISRVVYQHCASCHRPAGRAMPLLTYEEARPWAKAIRDEVLNRRMPPWDAVKGVGEFRNDPSLSLPEMDLLVNWVEGGAPEGDPVYLPTVPGVPEPPVEPGGRGREVRDRLTLTAPMTLRAIHPSGAVEVVAALPDGSIKRLLWVRDFRPEWNRSYVLRTPLRLPKGTQLMAYGAPVEIW